MKFDSQQFLKDIGLDMHITMLKRPEPITEPDMLTITGKKMLCPGVAVYTHINNLIATYGINEVKKVFEEAIEDYNG